MKERKLLILRLSIGIGTVFLIFLAKFIYEVFIPFSSDNTLVSIHIPRGLSAYEISHKLKEAEIIRNNRYFQMLTGLLGTSTHLQSGEYEFSSSMNLWAIVRLMREGKVKHYTLRIAEGATVRDIANLIEKEGFGDGEKFWRMTRRKPLIKRFKIDFDSLEGYLFPDTYFFSKDMLEYEILSRMVKKFLEICNDDYIAKTKELKMSLHEAVTLASIIEWEAENPKERRLVSAVFHNRLKRGENLQSCATVMYAIGKKKRLYEKDLRISSIYNTYKHKGLPPTPICNPGKDSLLAAIEPAQVDYLYFVSRGNGTHYFSKSYKEHLKAIQKVKQERQILKHRKKK